MKKLLAFLIAATFASLSVAADKPTKPTEKKAVKKHKKAEGRAVPPDAPKSAPKKAPANKKYSIS